MELYFGQKLKFVFMTNSRDFLRNGQDFHDEW